MGAKSIQHSSGMLSIAMLATAGLLAFVSVAKVTRVFVVSSRVAEATAGSGISSTPTQEQIDKALAADRAVAEGLKKANLFSPSAPKRCPVQEVFGILGNEALISGQWYKAGSKFQDANIVAVEPTCVIVEWNGQRSTLYPIQAAVAADSSSGRGERGRGRGGSGGFGGGGPGMTMVGGGFGIRGGGRGGNVSDADRQRMMEQFRNMQNMTPEQQQDMRERFRSMRGGGMGGGMDGGRRGDGTGGGGGGAGGSGGGERRRGGG